MTTDDLRRYADAWNRHDIDTIMSFMTADCIFDTGGGSQRYGTRYQGHAAVKARFIEVWNDIPNVQFENGRHFVEGDRGCSQWTFTGTNKNGVNVEIDGCDLFTFEDSKIKIKDSYIKNRT